MKNLLCVIGIVSLILSVLAFAFAAFSRFGYYHVLDGSAELYTRLHRQMIGSFAAGIVLAGASVVCLILRAKG